MLILNNSVTERVFSFLSQDEVEKMKLEDGTY